MTQSNDMDLFSAVLRFVIQKHHCNKISSTLGRTAVYEKIKIPAYKKLNPFSSIVRQQDAANYQKSTFF